MPIHEFPAIGLGTWQNDDPQQCAETVETALELGYRHIDTAQFYENESAVGDGIAAANVDREDIVIASKVHAQKMGLDYDGVIDGAEASCDRLGVEYLDVLYVHWPVLEYNAEETLSAFEQLRDTGLIDHIGVSNYTVDLLDEAEEVLGEWPFIHQGEMHPLLHRNEAIQHAQEHDYLFVAYSPLARGDVFDIPEVQDVAEKHGTSPAQVSLAWCFMKDNVCVIPKATSEAHLRDNLGATDLELDSEDVAKIDSIEREVRYVERDDAPWLES